MEWLTKLEITERLELSFRTFDRRLKGLREENSEAFEKLVDRNTKPHRYLFPELSSYLINNYQKDQKQGVSSSNSSECVFSFSRKTKLKLRQIFFDPMVKVPDEDELELLESIKSYKDKARFARLIAVMHTYVHHPIDVRSACEQHGLSFDRYLYWKKKIPAAHRLIERAKVMKRDESKVDDIEYLEFLLKRSAEGYTVTLTEKDQLVRRDAAGRRITRTLSQKVKERHIPAKPEAALTLLKSLAPEKYGYPSLHDQPVGDPNRFRDPMDIELENMSLEELEAFMEETQEALDELEKKYGKEE